MSVLLLRLAGPMQSWGTRSRFSNRDTGLEPSRSGVIGLLCAAAGYSRDNDKALQGFLPLRMAVRVDREGRLMRDYHTAQKVRRADTTKTPQETVLSERFYLADADFLVGLEGEETFLMELKIALDAPRWQLCLGRKAFVPALPVCEGVHQGELPDVLQAQPWQKRWSWEKPPPDGLRYVREVEYGQGEPRQDVPLSFVSRDRKFGLRHVLTEFHKLPQIPDPIPENGRVPQPTASELA